MSIILLSVAVLLLELQKIDNKSSVLDLCRGLLSSQWGQPGS